MKVFLDELYKLGIELSQEQIDQFNKYYRLLVEKNKVMNLTAITEYNEVLFKHFFDSITIVKTIDMSKIETVIDVGTGGGFPGIPLKIVFPHLKVTLLDSLNKRIVWLNELIGELQLDNIMAYHGRAEEFGHNVEFREKFDLCVSRAVANLATLSEFCIPFVKQNGYFVSYKAASANEEIVNANNAIKILNSEITNICNFKINDMERNLIVIKKKNSISKKYPRKSGLPSKEPLK